jgi:hypothetical protein
MKCKYKLVPGTIHVYDLLRSASYILEFWVECELGVIMSKITPKLLIFFFVFVTTLFQTNNWE